jgi:ISXO2-like transposase domain
VERGLVEGTQSARTTNTVEGYFSIFKRDLRGVSQHCSEEHRHRYLAEFDVRYSYRVALATPTKIARSLP